MTRHIVITDLHQITRPVGLALGRIPATSPRGQCERKDAIGQRVQFLLGRESLLHQKRCKPGQRALVVAGAQVVAWFHAFDRMPVGIHVDDAVARTERVESIGPDFPGRVEHRGVRRVAYCGKALPPT